MTVINTLHFEDLSGTNTHLVGLGFVPWKVAGGCQKTNNNFTFIGCFGGNYEGENLGRELANGLLASLLHRQRSERGHSLGARYIPKEIDAHFAYEIQNTRPALIVEEKKLWKGHVNKDL